MLSVDSRAVTNTMTRAGSVCCTSQIVLTLIISCQSGYGFVRSPVAGGWCSRRTAFGLWSTPSQQWPKQQGRCYHFTRRRSTTARSIALLCHKQLQGSRRRRRGRSLDALSESTPRRTIHTWRIPPASVSAAAVAATGGEEFDSGGERSPMERKNGDNASEAGALRQTVVGTEASAAALGRETSTSDKTERMGLNPAPPEWAPRWAVDMHPLMQLGASIGLYFFHMLWLSKSGITFPVQLIPNNHGLCQSVGLDTATGFAVLGTAAWARVRSGVSLLPRVTEPWKLNKARLKKKLPITFVVLIVAYLLSGLGAQLSEYILYWLSFLGLTMSVAMHRSIQVLVSHLVWVAMGVRIIGLAMKPFFFNPEKGSWVEMKWKSNWIWWVVGGYFVSSSLFNVADLVNQFMCPLPPDTESVVVKIINPENNDVAAMAMGSIAPCMSAPWWEEVLYRGFLLPALTAYLPLKAAIPSGAVLFALHHMNLQAMLPLSCLGLVWSLLYLYSGNLLVTVLVHAMWNSRVFLGSLLGL